MKIRHDKTMILNLLAVVGVISTAVLTHLGTKKYILSETPNNTKDKVKKVVKCYGPTAVTVGATIGCIFASDKIHMADKVSLTASLLTTQQNYSNLRTGVDKLDDDTRKKVLKNVADKKVPKDVFIERTDEKLFWEEYSGKFFTTTIDKVLQAEYAFNKHLSIVGYASINEFLEYLGVDPIPTGNNLGWSVYEGYYGEQAVNPWVDFSHQKMETDDGEGGTIEYYYLSYSNQPEINYDIF